MFDFDVVSLAKVNKTRACVSDAIYSTVLILLVLPFNHKTDCKWLLRKPK